MHVLPRKRQVQNAGHRTQGTGHRSQVTAISITLRWSFHVYPFVTFPVTSQSGISLILLFLGHRSLIKNKTQTEVINILNLFILIMTKVLSFLARALKNVRFFSHEAVV